ncbi:hypothetical protein B566_EDAN009985 [Ephemera danica]|nr:hypothetical protein B566_EDAN009985 [Ephemera danica]
MPFNSIKTATRTVNTLSQINTEVGKCRAWLRVALSDGLLSSYFSTIRRQNSALNSYYHRTALLRDLERLEVAQRLLMGLEPVKLELATNSSLLNVWPSSTLMLAGLWAPPMRACPVAPAQDVALSLSDEIVILEAEEPPSLPIPHRTAAPIDEDEALKIILRQPEPEFTQAGSTSNSNAGTPRNTDIPIRAEDGQEPLSSLGNSLAARGGWSSASFEDEEEGEGGEESSTPEAQTVPQSYDALLESYNLLSGDYVRTPDLRDFLKKFSESIINRDPAPVAAAEDSMSSSIYGMGFEVVPKSPTSLSAIPEYHIMLARLGKLPREPGLDSQNYSCLGCSCPIGVNLGRAKVCGLTGNYYCVECHASEDWTIPSRVLLNWDFRKYPVSRKAAEFLTEIHAQPLLDVSKINIGLYSCCDDMAQLQNLRIQLNLLRAYLFTCREPVIAELQKKVWPHEYLYEHVHLYSVNDLQQIPSGTLAHRLSRVVDFARSHVLGCWLCSQKGFICEICNNPQVIYPFDTDLTYRCPGCSAVFHHGCLNSKQPCPKCERRKRREEEELERHLE